MYKYQGKSVKNTDNSILTLTPYFYKNGKPTKITGSSSSNLYGPIESKNKVYIINIYYEKILEFLSIYSFL